MTLMLAGRLSPLEQRLGIASPIDGIQVAHEVRQMRGNSIRIVACTGYAQEAVPSQLRHATFDVILQSRYR
jgi:CheY-like chemotaxis protein